MIHGSFRHPMCEKTQAIAIEHLRRNQVPPLVCKGCGTEWWVFYENRTERASHKPLRCGKCGAVIKVKRMAGAKARLVEA